MSRHPSMSRSLPALVAVGLGGRGAAMFVNMIVLAVTSRLLPPVAFGEFAICLFIVDLGQAASGAFIGVPMLQRARMRGAVYHFTFTVALLIAIGVGGLLVLLARWLSQWLAIPGLLPLLWIIAPVLVLRTMASFFVGVLQRRVRIRSIVRAQSVAQIASALFVTLPLAVLGFDAWALVIGLAVSTLIELILLASRAPARWRLTLVGNLGEMCTAGFPTLLNRLLIFGADSSDRIVVGRFFGAVPLGYYARAASLVRLPLNLLGMPMQSALMAWFSRCQERREVAHAAIGKSVRIQSFLLPIAAVLFWLATPIIVRIMLGTKWDTSIPIAQVLFVGSLARLGSIPLESASLVLGYAWSSARRQVAGIAVLAIGMSVAISHGPVWIAVAVAASRLVYYILGLEFGVRQFGLSRTEILADTVRGLFVCAFSILLAAVAVRFVPLPGIFLQTAMLMIFGIVAGLAILFAPGKLIGPTGPFLRLQTRQIAQFLLRPRVGPRGIQGGNAD